MTWLNVCSTAGAAPAFAAAFILLAGCAGGDPHNRAVADDASECRALVNTQFNRQARLDDYRQDQTDMPFAASGTPGVTSAGLGTRFAYERDVQTCVRGSTANIAGSNNAGKAVATPSITVVPTPAH